MDRILAKYPFVYLNKRKAMLGLGFMCIEYEIRLELDTREEARRGSRGKNRSQKALLARVIVVYSEGQRDYPPVHGGGTRLETQ
jgi:hypothetical protein